MLLNEFFGNRKDIHLKPNKDKDENKMHDELFWFILDHDRLHKEYFMPMARKFKGQHDKETLLGELMPMVEKGCKEFYAHNKMEGKLGKLFPEELRKELCSKLYDHYTENVGKLMEGGNLAAGQPGWKGDPEAGQAQNINLQVTNRSVIVPILNDLLKAVDAAYAAKYKEPLWDPKLLKSQKFLSGSSLHFFNVKGIPDKTFIEKKPKVGDIDTMVDKEKEAKLDDFLQASLNQQIGSARFLGYQRGNEQFSSLWQLEDPPIKIQIDLEFVKFDKEEPTPWSRFSHSSDWNDLQAGVKGVFHKFLIQSFAVLTKKEFILRKQEGRGKARTWVDKPAEDSMFSFAVSSKEGGGLRAKYTPVLNPTTNEPEVKDGMPVMMALPAAGYEQDIGKMFQSLFGVKLNPKAAEQLAEKFWSFTGLLEVMNKLLEPEEKSRVLGSFLNKTFGAGAQGLYKNDPERDSAEKMAAIDLLMKTTGAKPPEGMDLEQMRQEYVQAYKVVEETIDEADDPTAPAKPNYSRQGIQHIYNRLPDGRVSSMEMRDDDFIELCKEIADNGGNLDGIQVNLKVDGAGIRFGKDEAGRPFFMTSKVTEPLYADNVGYFSNFGVEKGQSGDNLARTKKYDDALSLIVNSDFIKTLPADTIVQAEMLYNDMAQNVDGQLKFVNIPYDPKKLGKQMTLVPFMVKQYSTGEASPDQDKIIQKLLAASSPQIKIITNQLQQKGINVSKIIDPVVNMDANLVNALKARGSNPEKEQAKQILDQARQQLSSAIIDNPKLKGKDALGANMEGIVVNMPSGRLVKVTSQQMKSAMAAKSAPQQFGDTKTRTAVVAIGNFAGHKGHEQLINFAIEKAQEVQGTPFVFVGHKVGPDDPIDINTKLETLRKLFPGVTVSVVENQIDSSGQETAGNIFKKIEYELVKKQPFYNNIIITVGSDQAGIAKTAEQMQSRYSKFPPLAHVKVSAYVTPRKSDEGGTGVSTTQLRNALKTQSEEQAFQVWSQAYNVQKLGADWVKHLMDIARKNMGIQKPAQQPQPVAERLFTALIRPRLVENDPAVRAIQQMLNKKGANLDVDGKFGPLTKQSVNKYLPKAETGLAPEPNKNTAVQGKDVKERMMPASHFVGTPKHKLGPAAHLKGKMKRPARAGDLVGDAQESVDRELSIDKLATISDAALDKAYGYGRSSPGNTFGWQANLKSAEFAKKMIDSGVEDIERISDAIHKGWNVTAKAFVQNPDQFDDTEKLRAAGKLDAKLQQREKLMNINYAELPDDEKEKDRVVARALLQAIKGSDEQPVSEGPSLPSTLKSIATNGEPIAQLYERLKAMAKKWVENNGSLKGYHRNAAGQSARWFNDFYFNKLQADLYSLVKQAPKAAPPLIAFLKDASEDRESHITFTEISRTLPPVLYNVGRKIGDESLMRFAKNWDSRREQYENYLEEIEYKVNTGDDEVDTPAPKQPKSEIPGKQFSQAEEIVNSVLSKLPKKVAGEIRNAIARAPNKLQALQQELAKRKLQGVAESGKQIPISENYQQEISQLIGKILINELRRT